MAAATKTMITLTCDKCKCQYQITQDLHNRRVRKGTLNYCKPCMKAYVLEKQKNFFDTLTPEQQKEYADKRNWYSRASEEVKQKHIQHTKDQLASRTKEEQDAINKKNSDGLKKHWQTVPDADKQQRLQGMHEGNAKYWESLSAEEKHEIATKWMNVAPEELEKRLQQYSERMKEYNDSLGIEEQRRRAKNMQRWHENLTPEQKREFYERTHKWYHDLPAEEKINYADSKREWYDSLSDEDKIRHKEESDVYSKLSDEEKKQWVEKTDWYNKLSDSEKRAYSERRRSMWNQLSDEEKIERTNKVLSVSDRSNSLTVRFENSFNGSTVSNDYYYRNEVPMIGETCHSWDYGIYDKSTNELVMVVDLDGAYFHADSCDYDGLHSREEYDEKRGLSLTGNNVKSFIIQEFNFTKCFEEMVKKLFISYDEYIDTIFKDCRNIPFPDPSYSDSDLMKSFIKLCEMNLNDKYHKDISLNTRVGDRIIQNFHHSIYRAHKKGKVSPHDAWFNDDLLKKCISNRIIYQNQLNPNKILQGFNISKIAPKVSVFSAGRAKILINKYLSEFDTIFDPFSGFSGRMLGSLSLGKRYVGRDISQIHVDESNHIIKFLIEHGFDIQAEVGVQNILAQYSWESFPCLFTCPPYEDKEQWLDVDVSRMTCDDWIDQCLKRFKCKRYVFVVDYTERYLDHVVDQIFNRSHLSAGSEYIVKIDR